MAEFKPMEIKIEGVEDMRRLSAALEQYNASAPALHQSYAACLDAYTRADNGETEKLRAELDRARTVAAADFETIQARDKEIEKLQTDRSMLKHSIDTWRGRCNDLEQQIANAAPREHETKLIQALKIRLAEANDTIRKQAEEIEQQAATMRIQRNELRDTQTQLNYARGYARDALKILRGERSPVLNPSETREPILKEAAEAMRVHDVITELRRIIEDRDEEIRAAEAEIAQLRLRGVVKWL